MSRVSTSKGQKPSEPPKGVQDAPNARIGSEEFRDALDKLGWNQKTAAQELRISRNHVCGILAGRNTPSQQLLEFLRTKVALAVARAETESVRDIAVMLDRLDGTTRLKALDALAKLISAFRKG
jgi:transcriptional regulator with XRE-family HTH domain